MYRELALNRPTSAMNDTLGPLSGQGALDFPEQVINWYHGVAQPGTTFCVEYLRVPMEIAPMISISVIIFCPLYFFGTLLFGPSCLGYTGSARYGCSLYALSGQQLPGTLYT